MSASSRKRLSARRSARRDPTLRFGLLAIVLLLLIGSALLFSARGKIAPIFVWLIAVSVVTFLAYGYDKTQAKRGGVRVPEIILHSLALLGGFPGGWMGRALFRHKTRKPAFTIVLILSTIAYAALAYYLLRTR